MFITYHFQKIWYRVWCLLWTDNHFSPIISQFHRPSFYFIYLYSDETVSALFRLYQENSQYDYAKSVLWDLPGNQEFCTYQDRISSWFTCSTLSKISTTMSQDYIKNFIASSFIAFSILESKINLRISSITKIPPTSFTSDEIADFLRKYLKEIPTLGWTSTNFFSKSNYIFVGYQVKYFFYRVSSFSLSTNVDDILTYSLDKRGSKVQITILHKIMSDII